MTAGTGPFINASTFSGTAGASAVGRVMRASSPRTLVTGSVFVLQTWKRYSEPSVRPLTFGRQRVLVRNRYHGAPGVAGVNLALAEVVPWRFTDPDDEAAVDDGAGGRAPPRRALRLKPSVGGELLVHLDENATG